MHIEHLVIFAKFCESWLQNDRMFINMIDLESHVKSYLKGLNNLSCDDEETPGITKLDQQSKTEHIIKVINNQNVFKMFHVLFNVQVHF